MNELLWWFGRSSGLVAYVALWSTMFFGVMLGSRGGGGLLHSPTLLALHRAWSFSAVAITGAHVLAVVLSPGSPIPAVAALVPFASPSLTGAVALGTLASWTLLLLVGTSLARSHVPAWVWGAVHALSAGGFVLALAHGVFAGPDTASPWVRGTYVVTVSVFVSAVAHRLALASASRTASSPPSSTRRRDFV
ncbi:MAG: hypothetical protein Q8P18_31760 [Pseudomonadota bacterium]|nr:hypothetical protein [Pseudomonadota bacterium]